MIEVTRWVPGAYVVVVVAALPLLLSEYWAGLAAAGIALGIALLSYTLVTGEGGMVTVDDPEWATRLKRLREPASCQPLR